MTRGKRMPRGTTPRPLAKRHFWYQSTIIAAGAGPDVPGEMGTAPPAASAGAFLAAGDAVSVVSPCGPPDPAALDAGVSLLRAWGLEVRGRLGGGDVALAKDGYLAASDASRLEDLLRAFMDPDTRAVVCSRGGYGSPRLLQALAERYVRDCDGNGDTVVDDAEGDGDEGGAGAGKKRKVSEAASQRHLEIDGLVLRQSDVRRKRFFGFSDATALHAVLHALDPGRLVTFHSPMPATGLFTKGTPESHASFKAALFGAEQPVWPGRLLSPGRRAASAAAGGPLCTGRLVGGNLALVAALVGTPWEVDIRGALVCLEDVGEAPYKLDRLIFQLRHSKASPLGCAAGIVLGDFGPLEDHYNAGGAPYEGDSFWLDRLGLRDLGVPVTVVDFGHIKHALTLPLGLPMHVMPDGSLADPRAGAGARAQTP